jgi:hypothetical protein
VAPDQGLAQLARRQAAARRPAAAGPQVAPTYGFDSAGKIVVEPKSLMKKRKLPSPDYADALGLTFAGSCIARRRPRLLVDGSSPGKPLRRNLVWSCLVRDLV